MKNEITLQFSNLAFNLSSNFLTFLEMSEVRKRKTDRDDGGSKSKKPVKTKQVQAKSSPVTSIGSVF